MIDGKYAVSLIGYGGMGHWHAEVLKEFDEIFLYSIFDTDSSKIEEAKEKGYHTYDSFDEVLADEKVDILLLAVPNLLKSDIKITEKGKMPFSVIFFRFQFIYLCISRRVFS